MARSITSIKVEVESQRYVKDDFRIFSALLDGEPLTIKGETPFELRGEVLLTGYWTTYRGERQFSFTKAIPRDDDLVLATILASGLISGVGAAKASALVEKYGADTRKLLDAAAFAPGEKITVNGQTGHPLVLLKKVRGIGDALSAQIANAWRDEGTLVSAVILGVKAGMTVKQIRAGIKMWGIDDLRRRIEFEPYSLTAIKGFTWDDADALAQNPVGDGVPIEHDAPQRLLAALREAVRQYTSRGRHLYMPLDVAIREAIALAQPNVPLWETIKDNLEGLVVNGDRISLRWQFEMENNTAQWLVGIAYSTPYPIIETQVDIDKYLDDGIVLSEGQREAIESVLSQSLTVITGGPGTGKTTVLRVLTRILEDIGLRYSLAAFTGKAVRRIKEVTGREAHTLHRLFNLFGSEDVPFMGDVLIIDEASMVDASLMRDVLKRLSLGVRLVLLGDVDQLPPVDAGAPFQQILASALPSIRLTFNYRSESALPAQQILDLQVPQTNKNAGFTLTLKRTPRDVLAYVKRQFERAKSAGIEDIMVLTPVNKGLLGQHSLNMALKAIANPGAEILTVNTKKFAEMLLGDPNKKQFLFSVNDRVMMTGGNLYDVNDVDGQDLYNGTPGRIISIVNEHGEVVLGNEDDILMTVDWGDFTADMTQGEVLEHIRLGYALTIHKAQGSEAEYVILVLPRPGSQHADFYSVQLPYTGVTRAMKHCVVATTPGTFQMYLKRVSNKRRTQLADLIAVHTERVLAKTAKMEVLE